MTRTVRLKRSSRSPAARTPTVVGHFCPVVRTRPRGRSFPLAVPTANGELDHEALAASLGVDLSARPYPERVLWQAFAYTAFDPHADSVPELWQFPTGHLALSGDQIGGDD